MGNIDWDDNQWPLAYLITFRTFGTWLHGDERFSMDRHGKNIFGTPTIAPNKRLSGLMESNRGDAEFLLAAGMDAKGSQRPDESCSCNSLRDAETGGNSERIQSERH